MGHLLTRPPPVGSAPILARAIRATCRNRGRCWPDCPPAGRPRLVVWHIFDAVGPGRIKGVAHNSAKSAPRACRVGSEARQWQKSGGLGGLVAGAQRRTSPGRAPPAASSGEGVPVRAACSVAHPDLPISATAPVLDTPRGPPTPKRPVPCRAGACAGGRFRLVVWHFFDAGPSGTSNMCHTTPGNAANCKVSSTCETHLLCQASSGIKHVPHNRPRAAKNRRPCNADYRSPHNRAKLEPPLGWPRRPPPSRPRWPPPGCPPRPGSRSCHRVTSPAARHRPSTRGWSSSRPREAPCCRRISCRAPR